ncbi:MAG: DUF305 domain-containing protein [Aeromicrobium sp.]|uniref:DUF305 domain-containing protein n=1 Tax=Aeromicrobium sp. TaxID=1871063 RepID=UPI0039E42968
MRGFGAVTVVAALALTGCGGENVECAAEVRRACADPSPDPDPDPNSTDEDFVLGVQINLGTALQAAELPEDRSDDDALLDLADEMADELDDQLDAMRDWEEEWDLEPVVYSIASAFAPPVYLEPDGRLEQLEESEGADFDELWIEVMSDYSASIVDQAEEVADDGRDPELAEFVQEMIETHEAWLEELDALSSDA